MSDESNNTEAASTTGVEPSRIRFQVSNSGLWAVATVAIVLTVAAGARAVAMRAVQKTCILAHGDWKDDRCVLSRCAP